MQKTEEVINLTIDGKAITVPKGTTVYQAALKLSIEIPIFCYQDRMPPFGACRMCLVEVEKMAKLQTACTLEATEGMVVHTQSSSAVEGREGILELLLINHPLDCPICDRGGECPLQDRTLQHGPGQSRFVEEKRRFKKPIPLGPVLMLDRERCIVCARCTRFSDLISGDHALEMHARNYKTEVGTPDQGPAESKFIGNTIQICPVGALTSQVYRFRARPWDNDPTPSTCSLCPVGCSLSLDARDGEIVRTRSRENREINDIWLCDKGWFGYEFATHPDRLKQPLIRRKGHLEPSGWEEALSLIAAKIQDAKPKGRLAAIGGNPLTIEENFLFQQLMRKGAGTAHLDHRLDFFAFNEGLEPGMEMTVGECEELSFAVFFGVDVTEEFPLIWLRLRQAINRGAKVLFFGHFAPEIHPYLTKTILHQPGKELTILKEHADELLSLAERGKNGAFFVGRQYLATSQYSAILAEFMKFKKSLPGLSLNILDARGNSLGARLAGMRPDFGPLNKPLSQVGLNALQILKQTAETGWDVLYVAGANLAMKCPSNLWKQVRDKLGFLVVQDLFLNETAEQADVVLPTLCFLEKSGSFLSIDGHIQSLQVGKEIPEGLYSDADIFIKIAEKLDVELDLETDFLEVLQKGRLEFKQPDEVVSFNSSSAQETAQNNQLAATFAVALFDQGVRMRHCPHLIHLAKNGFVRLHPSEGIKRGLQDGKEAKLTANGQSIVALVRFDEQVAEKTVVLPLGFKQVPVQELGIPLWNGLLIDVEAIS